MTLPTKFNVQYEINPHMVGNIGAVDEFKAVQQWNELRNAIVSAGADVVVMPEPPDNCPDAVFTANAGLIFKDQFISSQFKHVERQPEENYFNQYFHQHKFKVVGSRFDPSINSKMTFEGAGDALFSHDRKHLWFGFGFRSSLPYKFKLDLLFEQYEDIIVRPLRLIDPRFYHLDTCFCPLDTGELLWYPDAFDDHAKMVIESWYTDRLISVDESDAVRFACNAVSIDDVLIMPTVSVSLSTSLRSRGYTVVQVDMSQYLQSGGACKCLTIEVVK